MSCKILVFFGGGMKIGDLSIFCGKYKDYYFSLKENTCVLPWEDGMGEICLLSIRMCFMQTFVLKKLVNF